MIEKKEIAQKMILKIYPGATFGFDIDMPDRVKTMGSKTVRYDPEATADSIVRVKDFLSNQMK